VLEKIETVPALRERLRRDRETKVVGLVPTMGALHAGHAELIKIARRECGVVVASIFVNPLQFDNPDDLARYPRTLDSDLALCREFGVDVVFAPLPIEVYPEPPDCTVDIGHLGDHLCGKFRPGHFRGVATIVLKLFQMVQPHRAYFGEKDAQQLAIIRRLVSDFNVPLAILEVPTVREPDGLAMSSRNRHLSPAQRAVAVCLYEALREGARVIGAGERRAAAVKDAAERKIPASEMLKLEYLEIVDPGSMQPVEEITIPVRIAGALWVGSTRLIDNVLASRS